MRITRITTRINRIRSTTRSGFVAARTESKDFLKHLRAGFSRRSSDCSQPEGVSKGTSRAGARSNSDNSCHSGHSAFLQYVAQRDESKVHYDVREECAERPGRWKRRRTRVHQLFLVVQGERGAR